MGGCKGKRPGRLIPSLWRQPLIIDGPTVNTGCCAGLQSPQFKTKGFKLHGQFLGGWIPHSAAGEMIKTDMNKPSHKCTGGQNHCL